MAVATVAASVFVNQLFKGANNKMGAASKNKRSFVMSENMKKLAKSVLNLAITAGISGAASEELKSAREKNEADNLRENTNLLRRRRIDDIRHREAHLDAK